MKDGTNKRSILLSSLPSVLSSLLFSLSIIMDSLHNLNKYSSFRNLHFINSQSPFHEYTILTS